jgi:hypothetical protein
MNRTKDMDSKVQCPECGHSFDIGKALHDHIADGVRQDILQAHEGELIQLKSKVDETQQALDGFKEKELTWDTELRQAGLDARRDVLDNLEDSIKERIAVEVTDKELTIQEYEDKTRQLKDQIEVLSQKVEQGSMQAQGEAQELAIEDSLREAFPQDTIKDVKKGQHGADINHTICDQFGKEAGVIVWESKRAKKWSRKWVSKIEKDSLNVGGDIAIIVSRVLPGEMDNFGKYGKIWVCRYHELVLLAVPLREAILRSHRLAVTQQGKQSKMEILYDYLAGPQFESALRSIYDSYSELRKQIDSERRSMNRQWKVRERLIDGVLSGATEMIGSIQGITGGEFEGIRALDKIDRAALSAPSDEEVEE